MSETDKKSQQKYKGGSPSESDNSPQKNISTDVLIVGAGAAGLFAAQLLGQHGLRTLLLESADKAGRKLAISGGGHVNFSNMQMSPEKFLAPPDNAFCRPALKEWTTARMLDFITKKAAFHVQEKSHGRLFLEESATDFVKYLLRECQKSSAAIYYDERLIELVQEDKHFIAISEHLRIQASKVILALGSPARPKLASCLYCWRVLTEMGHKVFPAKAALTPLNYAGEGDKKLGALSGIGVKVKLRLVDPLLANGERQWEDDLLFTHSGLSGPAILSASLYFTAQSQLEINFLPEHDFERMLDTGGKCAVRTLLRPYLPSRLVEALIAPELLTRKAAEISRKERRLLGQRVNAWRCGPLKPAGLDSAEVCSGGVDLEQIDPASMESKLFPGLYICGETQNVTGELGGYNIHWAFASAFMAARDIMAHS